MVVIRQVKTFDLPALFIPKAGNVRCSLDNRVLILHRKGATIYEIVDDPCPDGDDVVTRKSMLESPKKVETISAGASENILIGGNKGQILELLRDRVITPRGYQGIEFNNFFSKAEWSPARFTNGPIKRPRCLLATLTSNFQLLVHMQTENTDEDSQKPWVTVLDLTKIYNAVLLQKWTEEEDIGGLRFQQYKKRLYELNIVDFAWIPPFEKLIDDAQGVGESFFITAQANGTIVIWWIINSTTRIGEFMAEPVFTQYAFQDEIISTMKFFRVSESIGILAIGTHGGAVRIFRIEKSRGLESDDEQQDHPRPVFTMSQGIEICEKDRLSIDYFDFVVNEDTNILKSLQLDILIVKHPFYVCSSQITLCQDDVVCGALNSLPVPEGPIVGIDRYSEDLFMACHENGTLSLIYLKNGSLRYLEASANSIRDINMDKRATYVYNGFAFSSNKALAFVGKNLNCPYDHNVAKDPGKFLMFSTLPIDAWEAVKQLYIQRNFSLNKISDALLDFRYQIHVKKDYDVEQYVNGISLSEIAPQFLPLFYWVLRCIQLPTAQDWMKDESLIEKRSKILHHQAMVEDLLLQRHCAAVLGSVNEAMLPTLTITEAQTLYAMNTYMRSKPNHDHVGLRPSLVPAVKPLCPICTAEIEFKELKYESVNPAFPGEAPYHSFPGYVWNLQRCKNQHQFPVCILTLLPCEGMFRSCDICQCVALENPGFGRKPECPLCGNTMLVADVLDESEEEDVEEEEGESPPLQNLAMTVPVDVKLGEEETPEKEPPRRGSRKRVRKEV